MLRRCAAVLSGLFTLFSGTALFSATPYYVTDLGTLGGASSIAEGINSSGQVVGYSLTGIGYDRAFLYSNGTMTGLDTPVNSESYALGINNSGQVVGYSFPTGVAFPGGEPNLSAFLFSNGTMGNLGPLAGDYSSTANAINAGGQIVGTAQTTALISPYQVFLYSKGTVTTLPLVAANAINASGQIVGDIGNTASPSYSDAALYNGGGVTDLGVLPGDLSSSATGINSAGQVVGWSSDSRSACRAFLYSNGTMTDLGKLNGRSTYATAINDGGQIVGYALAQTAGPSSAWIDAGGTMTALNSLISPKSGWELQQATAINDSGWIVGSGTNSAGQSHAFLLTPALPGDANLDGTVDINDLTIVLSNFGSTGCAWSQGCMDGDPTGTVDMNDLAIVLTNFGKTYGASSDIEAVPEPSGAVLLLGTSAVALMACAWRRAKA